MFVSYHTVASPRSAGKTRIAGYPLVCHALRGGTGADRGSINNWQGSMWDLRGAGEVHRSRKFNPSAETIHSTADKVE
jgi:hypothetical protein